VNRCLQIALWIPIALLIGALQAGTAFFTVILQLSRLDVPGFERLFLGIALVYGGGWFIPALVIADTFTLKRVLSRSECVRYILLIATTAIMAGFLLPGMAIMIGFLLTGCLMVLYGFMFRKRITRQDPTSGKNVNLNTPATWKSN
jgi:hypothetical protein